MINEALLDCVNAVILLTVGNIITEDKATRDKEGLMYYQVRNYISDDRFNIDFRDEIIKRTDFFQPHFRLEPINNEIKQALLTKYPINPEPSVKDVENCWTMFKKYQSWSHNFAGPIYKKEYLDKYKSGSYSDVAILTDHIWQKHVLKNIKDNAIKVCGATNITLIHLI